MREQVVHFFQSLPDEGIAIHGTNLARAKSIQELGFLPDCLPGLDSDIWFNVQPPNINTDLYNDIRREIDSYVIGSIQHAYKATANHYGFGGKPESKTPALVVFKPLERFDRSSPAVKLTPYPMAQKSKVPIPKENIIGIIELHRAQSMERFTKGITTQIINLVSTQSIDVGSLATLSESQPPVQG